MKRKIVLVVFVSTLFLYMAFCGGPHRAEAGNTTIVYVDPEISYGTLGETFAVNVSIADVADFVAFAYKLRWNSTLLRCISYEKCDPAVDLGWDRYLTIRDDFASDRHWLAVDGGWPENSPFAGNITLVAYTFRVVGVGECIIDLYDIQLIDSQARIIGDWDHKDSLDDCYFEFRMFEHDLAVFLDSPKNVVPGDSVLLNATVFNDGLNDETDVEFQLLMNSSIVNSTVISFLQVGSSYSLSYLWTTSTDESMCYVSAYALAVPDEELSVNNIESARVTVSYVIKVPLHYSTIQEAVDAASPGDAILVSAGTYYEHLIIDKPLTLVGEESSIPTIDGNGSDTCLTLTADNVNINRFIIQDGLLGIDVSRCDSATLIGNMILNNQAGISLSGSRSNTIIGNTLLDNYIGILLTDSHNNTVYHNNFINSTRFQFGGDNLYNDLEGNYWSDYKGVDNDGDGVGDTAHVINENNQDEHPFTVPLDPIPIVWGGAIYPVELSSNSTVFEIDFRPLQRLISFNTTGLDGTIGFCNVTIPNSLLEDLWHGSCMVFVDGKQPLTIVNWTDGTFTYIYFTYQQSQHEVTIVPEFPSFVILPLFMIATLLAVIVYRRKHSMYC